MALAPTQMLALYRRDLHYQRETARIKAIRRELRNPGRMGKVLHRAVADTGVLNTMIDNRFATAGGSQGAKWAPLNKGTIIQKRRQGFGSTATTPLVRSGSLQSAAVEGELVYMADMVGLRLKRRAAPVYTGKGKARGWRKGKDGADTRRIEVYAQILNDGGGPRNLPPRPFFNPPKGDERKRVDVLRFDLMKRMYAGILRGLSVDQALPYQSKRRGRKAGG
jgi:hypothetical protein